MSSSADSRTDWGEAYRRHRPQYVTLTSKTKGLLEELLAKEGIDVVQIEARTKEVDSFLTKLARRPGRYVDPLRDMTDLAGIRVVGYYLSDVARIGSVIGCEFSVDQEHSVRQETRSDPDRFGYTSDHYVVRCSPPRGALSEWSAYADLQVEIQVRTVLQHAWALINHKLAYKRTSDVPDALIRQLSRVSALLEVGDEQFEAARGASERLDATYETRAKSGDLSVPIDVSSLQAYLANSDLVEHLASIASETGFSIATADITDNTGDLVRASQAAGFDEMSALEIFLTSAQQWGPAALEGLWQSRGRDSEWYMPLAFLLASLVWIGSDVDLDAVPSMTNADPFFVEALKAARQAIK